MARHVSLAMAAPHEKLEAFFENGEGLQKCVGTLIVLCSVIEGSAEILVWTLAEGVIGDAPVSPDRMSIGALLKRLRQVAEATSDYKVGELLISAAAVAEPLVEVRHTIAHGRPALTSFGAASVRRNSSWLREVRRRPAATLALSAEALDLAAEAADAVFRLLWSIGAMHGAELPRGFVSEVAPKMRQHEQRLMSLLSSRTKRLD